MPRARRAAAEVLWAWFAATPPTLGSLSSLESLRRSLRTPALAPSQRGSVAGTCARLVDAFAPQGTVSGSPVSQHGAACGLRQAPNALLLGPRDARATAVAQCSCGLQHAQTLCWNNCPPVTAACSACSTARPQAQRPCPSAMDAPVRRRGPACRSSKQPHLRDPRFSRQRR